MLIFISKNLFTTVFCRNVNSDVEQAATTKTKILADLSEIILFECVCA